MSAASVGVSPRERRSNSATPSSFSSSWIWRLTTEAAVSSFRRARTEPQATTSWK